MKYVVQILCPAGAWGPTQKYFAKLIVIQYKGNYCGNLDFGTRGKLLGNTARKEVNGENKSLGQSRKVKQRLIPKRESWPRVPFDCK